MIIPAVVGVRTFLVLREGMIIDTVLHHASAAFDDPASSIGSRGHVLFQTIPQLFHSSASGQEALVSIALNDPLADNAESPDKLPCSFMPETACQISSSPTNGVLLAMLGIAKSHLKNGFNSFCLCS
ncbi:MAG: hypothetical protein R2788_01870 [Saprospiraceae bacterium]